MRTEPVILRRSCLLLAAIFFLCAALVSAQSPLRFEFGAARSGIGRTAVTAEDFYTKEKGFGFESGAQVSCSPNGGKAGGGFCGSNKPFYFSAAVPEGNYKVTITFGERSEPTVTTVKAELRRLMLEKVETQKGKFATASFIVNVRTPNFPGGEVKLKDRERQIEWRAWDEKLTLEFNNEHPVIDSIDIERVDVPTIYILGDSTVCDQPLEPYASWGQMLTRFFGNDVSIANHAESGESLRSSLGAKRLEKVLSLIKPGDYLLVQYGHNDEKEKGEGVGAFTTFNTDLQYFVESARRKGAFPVVITPVQRRTFDVNGQITNSHGDYPEAVRQVAREVGVPLIDLNAMSKVLYETLGKDGSSVLFKDGDGTHHNNYGAYEIANCIVEAIRAEKLSIAKYLLSDIPRFDPSHPEAIKEFKVPASPLIADVKPPGN